MKRLVLRFNCVEPLARLNFPIVEQSANETEARRALHLEKNFPLFSFDEGCRTDELLPLIIDLGLQLDDAKLLRMHIRRRDKVAVRPVTILEFTPNGRYVPVISSKPDEAPAKTARVFDDWLTSRLARSWAGSQLWPSPDGNILTLNLLVPEPLDRRHPSVPLDRFLARSV